MKKRRVNKMQCAAQVMRRGRLLQCGENEKIATYKISGTMFSTVEVLCDKHLACFKKHTSWKIERIENNGNDS
jgi:hypothetical protein